MRDKKENEEKGRKMKEKIETRDKKMRDKKGRCVWSVRGVCVCSD